MLIFEYEHQKALIEKNNKSDGFIYCNGKNIDFLIYKNFKLFKNINDTNPINLIKVSNRTLVFKYKGKEN